MYGQCGVGRPVACDQRPYQRIAHAHVGDDPLGLPLREEDPGGARCPQASDHYDGQGHPPSAQRHAPTVSDHLGRERVSGGSVHQAPATIRLRTSLARHEDCMPHRLLLLCFIGSFGFAAEAEPAPYTEDDLSVLTRPAPLAEAEEADEAKRAVAIRRFLIGSVRFGSSARVDHGVERRREDGNVVDGSLTVGGKLEDHLVALHVGSDAQAAEPGEVDAGVSYNHADCRDLVAVHDLTLAAGWSGERQWVIDGDLLVGPLHLAAGREDGVRAFRLGGGLGARLPRALVRFTCDRVIIYADDAEARALATETGLQIGLRPSRRTLVQLSGGYTHDAITGAGADGVWEAALSLGFGL